MLPVDPHGIGQALDEMPRRDGVHQRSIVRQNSIQEQRVHPGALGLWMAGRMTSKG